MLSRRVLFGALALLALTAAVTVLALRCIDRPLTGIDDYNIFAVYAKNLADGHGFVYTPGGERVEGFTSLLWVLICTGAYWASNQMDLAVLVLNVVLVTGCAVAVCAFVLEMSLDAQRSGRRARVVSVAVALAWIYLSPQFVVWTTVTLMDTGLWSALVTWGTLAFARAAAADPSDDPRSPGRRLALAVIALVLVRPEAMVMCFVWIVALGVGSLLRDGDTGRAARRVVAPALAFIASVAALLIFRITYFGYPFPNTFYAKVSPDLAHNIREGFQYLHNFIGSQPMTLVALGGAAACLWPSRATWQRFRGRETLPVLDGPRLEVKLFVVSATVMAGVAIPVITGGDHFVFGRFFQPIWALLIVPAIGIGLRVIQSDIPRSGLAPLGLFVGLILAMYSAQTPTWAGLRTSRSLVREFDIAAHGRRLGDVLNRIGATTGDLPSIGVIEAGGVALTYRGQVVDLMGLNNVRMGHSSGDRTGAKNHAAFSAEVFYELSPDLVVPRIVSGSASETEPSSTLAGTFGDVVTRNISHTERFRSVYTPVLISTGTTGDVTVEAWCKRQLATDLTARGFNVNVMSPSTLPGMGAQ